MESKKKMKENERIKLICAFAVLLCLCSGLLFVQNSNLAAMEKENSSDNLETLDCPSSANTITTISNWLELNATRDNLTGSYILMNDLDSTTEGYEELAGPFADEGKGWVPIGTDVSRFNGSFDGQGY